MISQFMYVGGGENEVHRSITVQRIHDKVFQKKTFVYTAEDFGH